MRIGIDAREMWGRPTGAGRYLAQLLSAWAGLPAAAGHGIVLYVPSGLAAAQPAWRPPPGLNVNVREVAGGSGTWWEQVCLAAQLRRDRPDVFFAPAYTAPLASAPPVVLTIHDVSFLAHPEWFRFREGIRRRVLTRASARRAACVLTDTAFSRSEIVEHVGVPERRVRVVPLGVVRPGAAASPPHQQASRQPTVLFVGSVFNRRHLPELIRAVRVVADRHASVRLEIVGENRTYPHQDLEAIAAEAGVPGRTSVRSYVPDHVLAELYGRSSVFAFLSEYEGFGLTPLEALAHGIPVLVGDTPVAHEVYGDAAIYVDTGDIPGIAMKIEALLFDAGTRAAQLACAPAVLDRYSWERAAADTLAALAEAADRR